MRFRSKSCDMYEWHEWFAWYPVRINANTEWVWLETIHRRWLGVRNSGDWMYMYKGKQ